MAFGLRLTSDRPIEGPVPGGTSGRPHTRIWFDVPPPARSVSGDGEEWYRCPFLEDGGPAVTVWRTGGGAFVRWRYSDGTEFVVDSAGSNVWARTAPSATLADTATYLLGPILGFVLRQRGVTCLHASAVEVRGRAVTFVGPPYVGKSTTAAAFARAGHRIVSDDVVALDEYGGGFAVHPAYPQLRLWADSVALLYGRSDALPRVSPNWDKRVLDAGADCFPAAPLPLAAVYVLGERAGGCALRIERLPAADALVALVANTHVNYLEDPAARAREFRSLAALAAAVPVRRAAAPADPAALPDFCSRIVDDVQHQ
jgi:hypothetical protein